MADAKAPAATAAPAAAAAAAPAPAAAADAKAAAPAAAAAAPADAKDSKSAADNKATVVVVTGATGFIAAHIVQMLLAKGYTVRGTATSLKPEKLRHLTSMSGAAERLTMVEANLNTPGAFDKVVEGAHYVLHTASPFTMAVTDAKKDLLDPAVNGTLNVLQAVVKPAAAATVKRVVLTSSMAAITDSPESTHVYTEADWNVLSTLQRNPYYYSKKMAEEAAWKFAGENRIDLVVINPFVVLGPSLSSAENPSVEIVKNLLTKKFPAVLDLWWGFVDVRDVARAHILAFENANAKGRHLCCAVALKMGDTIAKLGAFVSAEHKARMPTTSLDCSAGTALAKLGSYAEKGQIGEYVRTNIARKIQFDNSKIRGANLGLAFTDLDTTLRDTYADLLHWGHLDDVEPCKLSEAELDAAAAALKATVPIADRKHGLLGLHSHVASFLGSEAVDALMKHHQPARYSRTRAVRLGEALLKSKRFYAKHDAAFSDSKECFYSFNAPAK